MVIRIRRSRSLAVLPAHSPNTYTAYHSEKLFSVPDTLSLPGLWETNRFYAENTTSKYLPHYTPEYRYSYEPKWDRVGDLWWQRRFYNRYGFWPQYGSYPRFLSEKRNFYYPYTTYHHYRPSFYPYLKFDPAKYRGLSEFHLDYYTTAY